MICFYHSRDLDGKCSAAIVKQKFPECKLYGIDYGDPFPWDMINSKLEWVYMVDFSLPIEDMVKLNSMCVLIWIDHHVSAIKDYQNQGVHINTFLGVESAACELTWNFIFNCDPPKIVRLLGRYDVWDHTDTDVLPFQMGARMENLEPDSGSWATLLSAGTTHQKDFVRRILQQGKIILEYQDTQNTETCAKNSFDLMFEGLRCIALNGGFGSRVFKSKWNDNYDMMITFSTDGTQWRVSLYQDGRPDVDCSVIAKKYGGGGHKGAAGFQCQQLPFRVVTNE